MSTTSQGFTARRRPGQTAEVAKLAFFLCNLLPHPSVFTGKRVGRLSFCPWGDDQIEAVGRLSLFADPRAAWTAGSYLRMEAVVPSPYLIPTGHCGWLDRVAIFPDGDHAGPDLGPAVLDYLRPYFNTVGPIDRVGLLRLDELISDQQVNGPSYIPIEVVSYSPMSQTSLGLGPRGWDRSGTYAWETPVLDDGPAADPPLTVAVNLILPAAGIVEATGRPATHVPPAYRARPAARAKAQAPDHRASRPSTDCNKRK